MVGKFGSGDAGGKRTVKMLKREISAVETVAEFIKICLQMGRIEAMVRA